MATRVDRPGIETCVNKINGSIDDLKTAAKQINDSMNDLPNHWEGAAYDKARATYEEEYQKLITTTVPQALENFRDYINQCMEKIVELDQQLAGN